VCCTVAELAEMPTYEHTIELDDAEVIALRETLASLQAECNLHVANKPAAPWSAYLRSIASIRTKLANGAHQTSGNTF
jgi:hypothetical protein